jgi:stress-induced morphogen
VVNDAPGGSQKIVPIAGDKQPITFACQPQYLVIWRCGGQHFTQLKDIVAQRFQGESRIVRHVMVKQELYGAGADI